MKRALITIALVAIVAVSAIYLIQEAQYASASSDARAATRASIRQNFAIERATQTAQAGARRDSHPGPDKNTHADSVAGVCN